MPALPATLQAAQAAGSAAAIAFALEALRSAKAGGTVSPAGIQALFTQSLAGLIADAMRPAAGDPAYQALVLRAHDAQVREYATLVAQAPVDRRSVRAVVDAVAHPAKIARLPADASRNRLIDELARLHRLDAADDWTGLRAAAGRALEEAARLAEPAAAILQRLLDGPALARLERGHDLRSTTGAQHYEALCDASGHRAGTDGALRAGHAAGRRGEAAEATVLHAFGQIASWLNEADPSQHSYRVSQGLRPPKALLSARHAKGEWDVALLRQPRTDGPDGEASASAAADLVLLAEVKATPSAATSDWPRLLRGLSQLAEAAPDASYPFASHSGPVSLSGASLRRLCPAGDEPPAHVIYCCPHQAGSYDGLLSASAQALLLAHPASLRFAAQIARDALPPCAELDAVWEAVGHEPRLGAALRQYRIACVTRDAMLHPDDLLAAAAQVLH